MKPKSALLDELQPEIDFATLADDISEFLHKHAGRSVNLAHNLATYLAQKYFVSDRKTGKLRQLIERHSDQFAALLDQISFTEFESLKKKIGQLPLARKKRRVKPTTKIEAAQRRKRAKNDDQWRRRQFRQGLIIKQFGTLQRGSVLDPRRKTRLPEGPCLDNLFRGEPIRMAGDVDSLENLFWIDRHRFPKSLAHKRNGRNKVYFLEAFVECLMHLLANRDGDEQWLTERRQRKLVLRESSGDRVDSLQKSKIC